MPGPGNSGGAPRHTDAGLQPERTALAWTRTTLALVVASVFFLRWMPSHGWFTATLIIVTAGTALAINLTQKARYRRAVHGISSESSSPATGAVLAISLATVLLGALAVYTVLFLPLPA